jgi:cation transport regulator ChaB
MNESLTDLQRAIVQATINQLDNAAQNLTELRDQLGRSETARQVAICATEVENAAAVLRGRLLI